MVPCRSPGCSAGRPGWSNHGTPGVTRLSWIVNFTWSVLCPRESGSKPSSRCPQEHFSNAEISDHNEMWQHLALKLNFINTIQDNMAIIDQMATIPDKAPRKNNPYRHSYSVTVTITRNMFKVLICLLHVPRSIQL